MTTEPEYGSDEYLLKKWDYLVSPLGDGWDKLITAKMLENMSQACKTPLQILAEESLRDIDE